MKFLNSHKFTLSSHLMGGIGNQLFQIIFSEKTAKENQLNLEYCLDFFSTDGYKRKSILDRLWPDAKVSKTPDRMSSLLINEKIVSWPNCINKTIDINIPSHITHLKLEGYWQDYRVLSDESIEDLNNRLTHAFDKDLNGLFNAIKNIKNSTAIHIRRHDYKHHGLTKERYYLETLRWLKDKYGSLNIFVFSDEPNYARNFLKSSGHNLQFINTGDDLADLYLMSACHIQVIANSSYSWWSAVLSKSKLVFYPDPWSLVGQTSEYLCPANWIKIRDSVENHLTNENFYEEISKEKFRLDKEEFFSNKNLPDGWVIRDYPCLNDASTTTNFDAHYVYHTAWATRRLLENKKALHIDIGSDIRFVTLASAFQKIEFLDYRPAQINLTNLSCGHADLMKLDFKDQSIDSISCMHVIEHIGLGRYGDEINFEGSALAMHELERVLAPGGLLYFVVPVGKPSIMFNAHRIFNPKDIPEFLSELKMLEFSFINDRGEFIEYAPLEAAQLQNYACGCYLFTRS